jgi:hypothetical protein
MFVSFFPDVENDSGLTIGKEISMTIQAAKYADLATFVAPSQPSIATDPDVLGGTYIKVSVLTSMLLLLSIN